MNKYIDADVVCPFYVKDLGFDIVCEGLYEDSRYVFRFMNSEDKDLHKDCYCRLMSRYMLCPFAMENAKKKK